MPSTTATTTGRSNSTAPFCTPRAAATRRQPASRGISWLGICPLVAGGPAPVVLGPCAARAPLGDAQRSAHRGGASADEPGPGPNGWDEPRCAQTLRVPTRSEEPEPPPSL